MAEISVIECEHCVYTDVGVSKDSTENGIYETHRIAFRFGPYKHIFIRFEAIR